MNTILSDALRGVSECPLRCGRNGGTPSGRDPIARWQKHLRHISSGCSPGIRRARKAEIPTKRRTRLPQENRVPQDALF